MDSVNEIIPLLVYFIIGFIAIGLCMVYRALLSVGKEKPPKTILTKVKPPSDLFRAIHDWFNEKEYINEKEVPQGRYSFVESLIKLDKNILKTSYTVRIVFTAIAFVIGSFIIHFTEHLADEQEIFLKSENDIRLECYKQSFKAEWENLPNDFNYIQSAMNLNPENESDKVLMNHTTGEITPFNKNLSKLYHNTIKRPNNDEVSRIQGYLNPDPQKKQNIIINDISKEAIKKKILHKLIELQKVHKDENQKFPSMFYDCKNWSSYYPPYNAVLTRYELIADASRAIFYLQLCFIAVLLFTFIFFIPPTSSISKEERKEKVKTIVITGVISLILLFSARFTYESATKEHANRAMGYFDTHIRLHPWIHY